MSRSLDSPDVQAKGRLRCAVSHARLHGTSADNPLLYAYNTAPRPASAPPPPPLLAPYHTEYGSSQYGPAGECRRVWNVILRC